jgi:hypothetical protein
MHNVDQVFLLLAREFTPPLNSALILNDAYGFCGP